ncbi:MAG: hypothetical protein LBC76_08210 [Treponema sp.]|jgi:hypothetical protein|nr:hypothetical protein [Treponema sp.]
MGWYWNTNWKSKQDVIDHFADMTRRDGYTVQTEGNWIYAEENGKPVDLVYLMTEKLDGVWGYKDVSVSSGPIRYNAPLWMVQKIHPIFENDKYYKGWLAKYQKRKSVLQGQSNSLTPSLFKEGAS